MIEIFGLMKEIMRLMIEIFGLMKEIMRLMIEIFGLMKENMGLVEAIMGLGIIEKAKPLISYFFLIKNQRLLFGE
jgi:hypothetical protein